jgi:hypothetical protein
MTIMRVKISRDEIEQARAAERLKGERDLADIMAQSRMTREEIRAAVREEFLDQGLETLKEEIQEKVQRIGRIQLLQELLGQPETAIAELRRLPNPDLAQLEESLKQQLAAKIQGNGNPPADKA